MSDPEEHRRPVSLAGCTPVPLASYLKALGVLRLVAEQADPQARGYWSDEHFVLLSSLDAQGLRRFFLDRYQPTPVLAPWNGGSGFYAGDNQTGIQPLAASAALRLQPIRDTIAAMRDVLDRNHADQRPEGDAKARLLSELRAELPDVALVWLDAAIVLTEESPRYPPLVGTGGNDGRLDFTNNFLQRIVEIIDPATGQALSSARERFDEALFGTPSPGLESSAVGQFAPGGAGGPNQTSGFDGKSLVNPWTFVFMLEGTLLFAAAATRRLESLAPGMLSYPFTVHTIGAGSGGTALGDEANARAEMWMPLWSAPVGLPELKSVLAEGRVTLGRRPAKDGLDFARAVARLGVERGISAFQRYAFLMRSGKAYFATPLNRVTVARNVQSDLADELDGGGWLSCFRQLARSKHAPARFRSLVRRLEDALFELALARGDPARRVQQVLGVLGGAQRYLAASPRAREACGPVPWLSHQWLSAADDGSWEMALAAALASLHGIDSSASGTGRERVMPMRAHLAPERDDRHPRWDETAGHAVVWREASLDDNLIGVLQRRLVDAQRKQLADKPLQSTRTAPLSAVAAWLEGGLDEPRMAALLPGLMLVRIPGGVHPGAARDAVLPGAYGILKPFFCTDAQLERAKVLPPGGRLELPAEFVRRMAAGKVEDALLRRAAQHLRAAGIPNAFRDLSARPVNGRRLLAALLVPIADFELVGLLSRLKPLTAKNAS